MKTAFGKMAVGMTMIVLVGLSAGAAAAVPHDAGFKARGLKDMGRAPAARMYAAPVLAAPQTTSRQALSYEPQAAPQAAVLNPCGPAVQTAQPPQAQVQVRRSYSYEPGADVAPAYRGTTGYRNRTSRPSYLQGSFKAQGRY